MGVLIAALVIDDLQLDSTKGMRDLEKGEHGGEKTREGSGETCILQSENEVEGWAFIKPKRPSNHFYRWHE